VAYDVWSSLGQPELMLLAGLFHDIAKGRGGDHSVLGEGDARAFCAKLGLPAADGERVAWLVRWHLLMSTTAQRQDITDPDVVRHFADAVGDRERLGRLYLLTVADIIGTSPKLWNGWKDRLLADLYAATRQTLRSDTRPGHDAAARIDACRAQALILLRDEGIAAEAAERAWATFPTSSFLRHRPEQIAWQTAAIVRANGAWPLVAVHPLSVRGSTELFVCTPDRDGLFASVTAMLDRLHFSVVEARILGSSAGMAMDTFLLLEADGQHPASADRAEELRQRMQRALAQGGQILPPRRSMSRQLKHFQMPPRIDFRQAEGRTRMALVCSDRPGLLAAVAQVLVACETRVHDARIATFGERVEDFFQLTDRSDAPLGEAQQQGLRQALLARLG
jgi:[protein-PII] uridylyltransferase